MPTTPHSDGPVTASHETDELQVTFSGHQTETDYGVPRSPRFNEVSDITVESVALLGIPIDPDHLPDQLLTELRELADDLEWEMVA